SIPYVAFEDYTNHKKITVMKFNGKKWVLVGEAGFSPGGADFISLAFSGSTPYVAYRNASNRGRVTVMKYE
ncbi:MAG: hypothetical protein ACHQYP_11695, partial [Nitrospiria bacterium]